MKAIKFEEMNLSQELLNAVSDMGFEEATPIQTQAIDIIMSGRDVIGQSQTGTGKTAAFGIPCIESVDPSDRSLQAIILCPTRELAIQISEEFRKLLKYKDSIRVLPVYGGQPIDRQIMALKKGAQVVIGTPGRVMDHMNRRTLKLETVRMVILDEADEMLDMGFREDIETILSDIPDERQTVLFSATMPKAILDLTRKFQNEPELIKVVHKELTVPSIEQAYFEVKEKTKLEALCRMIDMYNPDLALVFCNTKKRVDEVVEQLQGRGYFAEGLHGDLKQTQRDIVMKKFRNGTLEILVATDVAARGIDVDDIDVVFNFDLPQDEEYYIHRIGRTGRAGKSGKAYTFVVGKEIYKLKDIMQYTKAKIQRQSLPSISDVEEIRAKQYMDKIRKVIDEGHLTRYVNMAESMLQDDYSALDIVAALLKMNLFDEDAVEIEQAEPYEERYRNTAKSGKAMDTSAEAGMERLFLSVGRRDKIRASDIVGAIAGESGIPGRAIGAIDIYEEFTFVDVPKECVKEVLKAMKNKRMRGVEIKIDRAKKSKDDKKPKDFFKKDDGKHSKRYEKRDDKRDDKKDKRK